MSIAVLIGVHDGLVLASDSASTLSDSSSTHSGTSGSSVVLNVYDNANKIFNIIKGQPIGCIAFGSGSIGNASVATLIKDLRKKLSDTAEANRLRFNVKTYSMEQITDLLGAFLGEECKKLDDGEAAATNIGVLLGGYSAGKNLGESWSIEIKAGVLQPARKLRKSDEPAINWGGQDEVLQRMVIGFSPGLYDLLAQVTTPTQSLQIIRQELGPILTARLQAPMVFAPMPIQDAIDLARFLVHSAIMYTRFTPGPKTVGGPIEIATITKHEQFKWISRKHYYESNLNKEPVHVAVDRPEQN